MNHILKYLFMVGMILGNTAFAAEEKKDELIKADVAVKAAFPEKPEKMQNIEDYQAAEIKDDEEETREDDEEAKDDEEETEDDKEEGKEEENDNKILSDSNNTVVKPKIVHFFGLDSKYNWASGRNDWRFAEDNLRRILKIEPNHANALNGLGYILSFQKEKLAEAKDYMTQALRLSPNNAAFLDSMGWFYFRMSDLDNAIIYLKKAAKLSNDPEIAAHLAEALWKKGQKNESNTLLKQALDKNPDNPAIIETMSRLK